MENTNRPELTPEVVESTIEELSNNISSMISAVDNLQSNIENAPDNVDPINHRILSESNLMNYSRAVDCSVITYTSLAEPLSGQSAEEFEMMCRQTIVNDLIKKNNPKYNFNCYSDANKSNLIATATFVVCDYEFLEVDGEETTYYVVKVVSDNSNTILNNKYYIEVSGAEDIANGSMLELFILDGNELISAELFAEISENTTLKWKGGNPHHMPGSHNNPTVVHQQKIPAMEKIAELLWDVFGKDYIVDTTYYYYSDCCVKCVYTWRSGKVTYSWACDPNCYNGNNGGYGA